MDWSSGGMPEGIQMKRLGLANGYVMELYQIAPNTVLPKHIHHSPEFLFVLEGEVFQDGQPVPSGWSVIAETGTKHDDFRTGEKGARTITVYGTNVEFI
ncbi:MAG: cupin domain-containing protein [Desulfobacterales bacterium]